MSLLHSGAYPEEYRAILKRKNIIVFAEYGSFVWNAKRMFDAPEDCLDHLMMLFRFSGAFLLVRSCTVAGNRNRTLPASRFLPHG